MQGRVATDPAAAPGIHVTVSWIYTLGYNKILTFLRKRRIGTLWWLQETFSKAVFRFFEPFRARLATKFAKSAHVTQKKFSHNNMGIKKSRIWRWLRFSWENSEKSYWEKDVELGTFVHSTKTHFNANNFFVETFLQLFKWNRNQPSNYAFFNTLNDFLWEKLFLSQISTFSNLCKMRINYIFHIRFSPIKL